MYRVSIVKVERQSNKIGFHLHPSPTFHHLFVSQDYQVAAVLNKLQSVWSGPAKQCFTQAKTLVTMFHWLSSTITSLNSQQ